MQFVHKQFHRTGYSKVALLKVFDNWPETNLVDLEFSAAAEIVIYYFTKNQDQCYESRNVSLRILILGLEIG